MESTAGTKKKVPTASLLHPLSTQISQQVSIFSSFDHTIFGKKAAYEEKSSPNCL